MIKRVVGIHYSPAGGTAKMTELLVAEIAERLSDCSPDVVMTKCCDIRDVESLPPLDEETVAVIGMPVYMGKVPLPGIKLIRKIRGGNAVTITFVSYSGRTYGNALYELKEFADERGFVPVGAGAFAISYRALRGSSRGGSITMDTSAMSEFAGAAGAKIKRLGGCEVEGLKIKPVPLDVRGRMPMHRISRISPRAAELAQEIMDVITFKRQESEWFL